MGIANPESGVAYCILGEGGAVVEWQNPSREIEEEIDYPWQRVTLEQAEVPVIPVFSANVTTLVETVIATPGSTISSVNSLDLNKFYTFAVSGVIQLATNRSYDACFFIDGLNEPTPNTRLKTSDEAFEEMFFLAVTSGDVSYQAGSSSYSVGYIGNNSTISFELPSGGSGSLSIEIYENEYSLTLFDETLLTQYYADVRNRPFFNLNLACGGSCPTSTGQSGFECDCNGDVSCYYDDREGTVQKIFQGSANA